MRHGNRELWIALIAIVFSTLSYLGVLILVGEVPGASDFYGHALGILGFILMLATETLYSLRKRSRSARWGKMSAWLQFHIFTGLVGPYMVLLHSAWKFNGLAGMVMLLTVVIVVSGFVGRYIYTAVPRSLDGAELEASILEQEIQHANGELNSWLAGRPESIRVLARRLSIAPKVGSIGMFCVDWSFVRRPGNPVALGMGANENGCRQSGTSTPPGKTAAAPGGAAATVFFSGIYPAAFGLVVYHSHPDWIEPVCGRLHPYCGRYLLRHLVTLRIYSLAHRG